MLEGDVFTGVCPTAWSCPGPIRVGRVQVLSGGGGRITSSPAPVQREGIPLILSQGDGVPQTRSWSGTGLRGTPFPQTGTGPGVPHVLDRDSTRGRGTPSLLTGTGLKSSSPPPSPGQGQD